MWTDPAGVTERLARWTLADWWTSSGKIGLLSLAKVKGVGRQHGDRYGYGNGDGGGDCYGDGSGNGIADDGGGGISLFGYLAEDMLLFLVMDGISTVGILISVQDGSSY